MSDHVQRPLKHLLGLVVAVLAALAIIWAWVDGLQLLNGTLFSELRYFIFAGFVVTFLSLINKLMERLFH